jgi:predicted alpha/beta-fold hydrolase
MMRKFAYSYLTYCTLNYFHKGGKLDIQYNHNKLKEVINTNQSLSHTTYYPSFFFPSGNMQTMILVVMNTFSKSFKSYSKTRKVIEAKDGENIYVDFSDKGATFDRNEKQFDNFEFLRHFDNSNILVLVPGALGSSDVYYHRDIMEKFFSEGFKCITVNHRGILEYKLKGELLSHLGYTDDLHAVFDHLNKNIQGGKYYVLGTSLGGNIVTKFVGELGDKAQKDYNINCGISVCGPLHYNKMKRQIEAEKIIKFYSKSKFKKFKEVFQRNQEELLRHFGEEERDDIIKGIDKSYLMSHFYEEYLTKSYGYKDVEVFNAYASGYNYVQNIKVPFLCIFSKDDPMIPIDTLEGSGYEKNENFVLMVTKHGGHCGFFQGFSPKRWIYKPVVSFAKDISLFQAKI